MEEIISMIPVLVLALIILFSSNYFLKKDKENNKNKSNEGIIDFGSFINLKTKYAKIFSIIVMITIILKIIYILLKEFA
jgi:hypothetical protein